MTYALDTNTAVAALNRDAAVRQRLLAIDAADILIPAPVAAELIFGAHCSARPTENLARAEGILQSFQFAPFDAEATRLFGRIKAELRRRGITKQDFDLAIATIALARNATVVTNDHALLDGSIAGLTAEDWLAK